jgi:hypothetical protein
MTTTRPGACALRAVCLVADACCCGVRTMSEYLGWGADAACQSALLLVLWLDFTLLVGAQRLDTFSTRRSRSGAFSIMGAWGGRGKSVRGHRAGASIGRTSVGWW